MTGFDLELLRPHDAFWPRHMNERLGSAAPSRLWIIGDRSILGNKKLALFCSIDCTPEIRQLGLNTVRGLGRKGLTFISGFHSGVEKDLLQLLLNMREPVIVTLARSLQRMRVPEEWQDALSSGRLLLLSRFEQSRRADKQTARRRNELVAAIADEALVIHSSPGGSIHRLSETMSTWGILFLQMRRPADHRSGGV